MKNKIELVNKKYGTNLEGHLLKQYELFVNSSEKISSKRMSSNQFYVGLNMVLFGIVGYFSLLSNTLVAIISSIIGIFLCLLWTHNISSYRKLNKIKFKVIHELENYLPSKPFQKEDEYLESYYTLTSIEKFIPLLFIILYSLILMIALIISILSILKGGVFYG